MTTSILPKNTPWPTRLMGMAAIGAAVITVAHPSATRQFTWPWILLLSFVWLGPIAATLGGLPGRSDSARPNALLGAGLIVLAGGTLFSAATSPFASLSLLRIWPTLAGVGGFFWLHDWLRQPADPADMRSRNLSRGLALFGALLAVVSLAGWRWHSAGIFGLSRNEVPFGHSTYTAGAMLLILPWLAQTALESRGVRRAVWGGLAGVAVLALLATSSRGGVLAAAAVCIITASLVVWRAAWPRRVKGFAVVFACGLLLLALVSNPRLGELVRGGAWGDSARESNAQRFAMLEAGWKLGAARPLTGWGPGTVPLAYPLVRGQLSGGVDNVLQLHNTPAQFWATLGLPGILALVLLLAATGGRLWQVFRSPTSLTLTAAASLLGYGLFALTDHQLDLPAMNALLVVNLALLFCEPLPPSTRPVGELARRMVWPVGIVILAVPLFLTGRDLLARHAYEQSLEHFESGHTAEGQSRLEAAAQLAPYDPYYRQQLAGRLLAQRAVTQDPTARAELTSAATSQLERSLGAGVQQEFAHFNLGWLDLENGRPQVAVPHFVATVRDAPHRGGAYFGLGLALRDSGHEAAAVRAFALEWLNDPAAFTAPVWEWPDFAPLRPQVEREADRLLAELAPAHPTASYVRNLWSWWILGGRFAADGFNLETTTFAQTLAALSRKESIPLTAAQFGWGRLLGVWQQQPEHRDFGRLAVNDPDWAAALSRRAQRHPPPDWHGFLTAGLESEPALLLSLRPTRPGYGVLALHPDGPILSDLYIMQQNRLVSAFASTLFPPKGWMPARELLQRLPTLPESP